MQKNVLIALAVIGTLTAGFFLLKSHKPEAATSELKDIYNQWKLNYKINVGAAEDNYRFGVFSTNYGKIQAHNSLLGRSYNKGLNAFTHLTPEEFSATHFGLKNVRLSTNTNKTTVQAADAADWRSKMNAVKDQGQCGSCWAFSTVGAIEGLHSVVKGNLYDLSEQELVDCSESYGNQGCNGGLMDYGFQYAIDNKGLATEKAYPYTAADGDCQTVSQRFGAISKFTDVTASSKDALIAALAQQPVSVAIEADTETFQSYSDGVITDYDGCGTQLDHGVVAVGYNTVASGETPGYYIVRNSWGTSWGENGHVRLAIIDDDVNSGAGMCGIQLAASYPSA